MNAKEKISLLQRKAELLYRGEHVDWFCMFDPPSDPRKIVRDPWWPRFDHTTAAQGRKNAKNWYYAEIVFPEKKAGVPLAGQEAWLFINGWMPFTLWLDGKQMYRESRPWFATGPIADPLPVPVVPGARRQLVICIEPTELPGERISLAAELRMAPCVKISVELNAAATQLECAAAVAESAAERRLVEKAAARIDGAALEDERWERTIASIAEAEKILSPLSPRVKALKIHIVGHSHIDMDWMWTWEDTVNCIRRDMKAAVELMDEFPDLTFTHSQIPTYRLVMEKDPEVFRRIVGLIKQGRWENAAGTWVEGDLNMADGESIARHMLYAADWSRRHLGSNATVLWEPDTFGHPGNMPQLARLGEFDCYFHMRCGPDKINLTHMRNWVGDDGTGITAYSGYYQHSLRPGEFFNCGVLDFLKSGRRNALCAWGLGDHGGGMSRWQINILNQYRRKPLIPTMVFSTMRGLHEAVRREKPALPSNKGQTYSLFEGCFTTHASIKKYNRACEGALLSAEAMAAMAGINANNELRDAWTNALFNHFHDIMDGAAVHDSYINAHARAESALRAAVKVTRAAAGKLAGRGFGAGLGMAVFNQLGFERAEPVRALLPGNAAVLVDDAGRVLPAQKMGRETVFIAANMPPFSGRYYRAIDGAPGQAAFPEVAVDEEKEYFRVETGTAVVKIAKCSGVIGSYFDKRLGMELVSYGIPIPLTQTPSTHAELGLNVFQLINEAPNQMTAWLINDELAHENLMRGARVSLLERGPVFARFKVEHKFRGSAIEEHIVFYRDFPRVDFDAAIDWREKGDNNTFVPQLKVSFAARIGAARLRTEGPFAVREIPADGIEMPTQKWADISGDECGLAVYNDSKYGIDALGPRLRLTLLRSPYYPDPDPDTGRHEVRFAFEPHAPQTPAAELIRKAMSFNSAPVCARAAAKPARLDALRLAMTGADSVVCTALRRAEHSNELLLRLFETSGKPCRVVVGLGRGLASARLVNFLENPIGRAVRLKAGRALVAFRPFEVKTLLVRVKSKR